MKKVFAVLSAAVIIISCTSDKDRYINLTNGKTIEVEKDNVTGAMIDKNTKEPIYIYVDTKTNDTIYGKTGEVINGHVVVDNDKKYVYDNDVKVDVDPNSVEYKDGDQKVEIEKDGDIKIKDGDSKVKIDGETGERKVKKDD
ncbi:hypothetical protein CAP36_04575 [Chitinophagaceae bacterium IBVUCB2]|nr:hypothetical protein CAP36_04575 [Chitinophagaceae bacterium IBVUCB2]